MPPLPEMTTRLWQESFDAPYFALGTNRTETVNTSYGLLVSSWSGYALERAGKVTPFVVAGMDGAGKVQVASEGAIRFWLTPYWGSAAAGGNGPGVNVRLLELVAVGEKEAVVAWSLQVSPKGNEIYLFGQSETGAVQLLSTEITWTANTPHGLALNYSPTGTVLFVDGELAASGTGTYPVPPGVAGLVVGSAVDGTDAAGGYVDKVATFAKPFTLAAVRFHYNGNADEAAMGPVSAEEWAAELAMREEWAKQKTQLEESSGGGMQMMMMAGGTSECYTNAPLHITNIFSAFNTNTGWTVQFDIQGSWDGTDAALYDIFCATNIIGSHITNSQWFWLERGPTCATYQYVQQPEARTFYILGTPKDSDGDGLTDAWETLVTKSRQEEEDTDGDGWTDFEEIQNGTDPNVPDAPFKVRITRPSPTAMIP